MNTILYEIKDTVGLPAGHLGDGKPDALYIGSFVRGHRIDEFIPRLTEIGAIAPAMDQSQSEIILDQPNGLGGTITGTSAERGAAATVAATPPNLGVASMTVAQMKTKAEELGIEIPRGANKADIQTLIDAHFSPANGNGGDPGDENDEPVQSVTNGGS